MAKWRLAASLKTLRRQVDAAFPHRSKISDGTVGDTAHASRKSDHNPNAAGVVCAMDITDDPKGGLDCYALAAALTSPPDPRVKYIIWRRRIWFPAAGPRPGGWSDYDGANPHDKHLHLSVKSDASLYDDASPWELSILGTAPKTAPQGKPEPAKPAQAGREELTRMLQELLVRAGLYEAADVEGIPGPKTRAGALKLLKMLGMQ